MAWLVQAIRRDFIECVAGKLEKELTLLRTEMHQIVGTTATAVRAELHKEWLTEGGALHAHLQAEVAAVRTDLRMESQAEGLALRAQVQTETKQVLEKLDGLRLNVEMMQSTMQVSMRESMQESLLPVCMQQVQEEVKQIQHSVSHTTIAGTNRLVDVEQRLLERIGEVKASIDVLPKCLAVQSVATEASSQIRDNVLEVRGLVSDLQTVGIAQIFDAVLASKTPVIDEIRKVADVVNGIAASQSFRSDVAQVMDEVQKMAKETRSTLSLIQADIKKVEAAKVIEEISRVKTEVDFTTVFRAIKAARVDVAPLVTEISKLKVPEVRLGPVITEIQKFHGDVRAIAPMVTEIHKMQGDMKKHVTTDTLTRQVLQVTEEISKLRVDLDPGQLINTIKEASKSDTASVLTSLKKVTKESDLVALHSAMQDTRSDMAVLLAEMKKASRVDMSPLLSEVQKLKVDTSPLIDEIKRVKAEIDFTTVVGEIKAAQTDLAPVLSEIQQLKSMKVETVDEIKGAMTEIDFSAICKQIEASRIDVAPLMSEIQKVKAQTSPLLGEIKKVKAEIDFTSVFEAIKAAQIDVTPLLSEIHSVTTSPLTDEIRKAVAAIDFTSVFSEIKAAQIDMAPFLSEIQTVKDYTSPLIDEIRKAKAEIDFTTVLTAIQAAQVDMTPLMSEIQRVKVDVSPLSEDIQKTRTETQNVVLNEIQNSKVSLDPVLIAIQKCQDGLQAITATTDEIRAKAEASPILEKVVQICKETSSLEDKFARGVQATQDGQVQVISEIQALAASQASTSDTTLGSMRAIIQTCTAASLQASMEVYMQEVRAELNQVHQNVSQTTTAGTQRLSDVERSVLEGLTEVKTLVDILPNSMAVQSVQMEATSRALDNVLEVLKAIQGAKMDMSPLTTEIHQMRADLKFALPTSVVVPTDLNPSVVVQNVNRRGRIRFDMKTGLLTFVSSITFVRRAPSESPTATFEHPEEVRAAMGDAAEIIRLLNVPTTVVRYQLKENVDRLSITDTLQKWMQDLGHARAQLVLQTLQNQGAPVALLTAETRERSTEGIELFVRLSDNASLKY